MFPQPVLTDIAARITQPPPPAAAAPQQPTAPAATVPAATYYAPAIDVPTLQQPAYVYGTAAPQQPLLVQAQQPLQPMGVMAYGGGGLAVQDAAQPAVYMQQLPPGYGVVQQDYAAAPAQVVMMQPQPTQPLMAQPAEPPQPAQPPQQAPVNVADLMASLISAGILAAPTATPAAALASSPLRGSPHPAAAANGPSREGTPPAAAFPTRQEEELPMSAEFTPERIKVYKPRPAQGPYLSLDSPFRYMFTLPIFGVVHATTVGACSMSLLLWCAVCAGMMQPWRSENTQVAQSEQSKKQHQLAPLHIAHQAAHSRKGSSQSLDAMAGLQQNPPTHLHNQLFYRQLGLCCSSAMALASTQMRPCGLNCRRCKAGGGQFCRAQNAVPGWR